ncbi:MAG: hypothetical protein ACYC1E_05855 [Propionibacteriaceae bacterium]
MTTHTPWPVAREVNDSEPEGVASAWVEGSSFAHPLPASLSDAHLTVRTTTSSPDAPAKPWRTSSVVLLLLVLTDVTLTAVLLGGQTWWGAAAAWGTGLFLVSRRLRPRLV